MFKSNDTVILDIPSFLMFHNKKAVIMSITTNLDYVKIIVEGHKNWVYCDYKYMRPLTPLTLEDVL